MRLTKEQIDNWKETANGKFALMGNIAIGGLGHLNDLLESIAALESDLAEAKRGMEKMECGHPKLMLNMLRPGYLSSRSDMFCTACLEIAAAYERGKLDVLDWTRNLTSQEQREVILKFKDKGPKGGSE